MINGITIVLIKANSFNIFSKQHAYYASLLMSKPNQSTAFSHQKTNSERYVSAKNMNKKC